MSSRTRSRSPTRHSHRQSHAHRRSRSPGRGIQSRHREQPHTRHHERAADSVILPLGARPLHKSDLAIYRPMFALYLDIQKQIDMGELLEDEVKGRWKSFVGKWNRGELAEGWYDPKTLDKAIAAEQSEQDHAYHDYHERYEQGTHHEAVPTRGDSEDDDFGPLPPSDLSAREDVSSHRARLSTEPGPSIPTFDDLRMRDEVALADDQTQKRQNMSQRRAERKADIQLQKARLDDLTPRAGEAGSRERQLENKRLKADANRSFASGAHDSGAIDMKETDVMGDEDSLGDLKRMQKENERKKNEREIKREEILRARIAEREARMRGIRQKEEKTMDMLRKIAQARFG